MKNFTLTLIACVTFVATSFGQLTYSAMSDTLVLEDGVEHKAEITIFNNDTVDYRVEWRTISKTLLDNDGSGGFWVMQFCDCNNCYGNDFAELPFSDSCNAPVAAGTSTMWYLTVDPAGESMFDAEFVVEVNNKDTREKDTITYVVLAPSSVVEIPNYGRISAYPNPVHNELNIQYALQNVASPEISVYNTVGALVQTVKVNGLQGNVTINTADLTSGMYIYVLKSNGEAIASEKFNVMH